MIKKAVIAAAGLGTRLLPATKEQPKEMLPVFAANSNGQPCLKPLLQLVFEQLFDAGVREFCFVVGRGKRAIEDHFTQDYDFVQRLKVKGRTILADDLESFYRKVDESLMIWVNQPEPKGFGDAVLRAQSVIGNEEFLVHAGDTCIVSSNNAHLQHLRKTHSDYQAEATFLLQQIDDPRQYGVAETEEVSEGTFRIKRVVEKPQQSTTRLAIMPIYVFDAVLFKALQNTTVGVGGELQLTDGIQKLLDWGMKVYGVSLKQHETRVDVGNPDMYWEALKASYELSSRSSKQTVKVSSLA